MKTRKIFSILLILCLFISISGLNIATYAQSSYSGADYKVYISGYTITKDYAYHPSKSFAEKKYKVGEKGSYIVVFSGPIYDYMKTEVEKEGAVLQDYIPEYAFFAIMTPEIVNKVKGLPYVLDVLVYQPEYKIDPKLKEKLSDISDTSAIDLVIKFFDAPVNLEAQAKKINIQVQDKSDKKAMVKAKLSNIKEISEIPEVQYIGLKSKNVINNDIARGMILGSTGNWDTYYDGEGETVAVSDTGLDTGVNDSTMHQDLQGRISQIYNWCNDSAADYNGHGTHVAGSIVGTGAASGGKYKGTAPGANLVFQAVARDSDGALTGIPSDLNQLFQQSYDAGARTQSNSWGSDDYGTYNDQAADVDQFVWNHKDMTILFSAGNSGSLGDNTICSPGTAKNCITVGASENFRPKDDVPDSTKADNPHDVAYFSSHGWCNDGRIKPDIVSPGTWIISTKSSLAQKLYWPSLQNSLYQYMSGTSMSAPLTAGAVAAAKQYIKTLYDEMEPSAALIKALFINGATDVGLGVPSKLQGWGKTNLNNAVSTHNSAYRFFDDQSTALTTGNRKTYTVNVSSGDKPFRVTLAWTDYPASAGAIIALVNDLDLKVTSPSGTVYYGNDFTSPYNSDQERRNNVENVFINNPQIGNYTVEVIGFNIPQGPQDFAFVSSNNFFGTVSNISASTTTSSVNLSWDNIQNATSYDVQIDGTTIVNCSSNSYQHAGLQSASVHTYKIRPRNGTDTGTWSYPSTFCTNITVPINLKASAVSHSSIKYTWDACAGALWYLVEINGNSYRTTTNSMQIDNLISNKTYNTRIKAFADNNCSDWTEMMQTSTLSAGLTQIPDLPTRRLGLGSCESGGKIYAIGGADLGIFFNTVECYNTSTGAWETKSGMAYARANLGIVSNGSKIYAVGGNNGTELKKLEVYDTNTNTWSTLADMPTARHYMGTALVNGKIYVIGGYNGAVLNTVEAYDIATNTWQSCSSMPMARDWMGIAVVGNKIYIIGGENSTWDPLSTVEVYDTATDTWSAGIPMPTALFGLGAVTINNRIYAVGGSGSDAIEEFDTSTNTWSAKSFLPSPRSWSGIAAYNGTAYIIGGHGNSTSYTDCYQYDPSADFMVENLPLPDSRYNSGIAQLNGKIYVSGGIKSYLDTSTNLYTWADTNDLLEYDPSGNTWTNKAPMSMREDHSMVALNGKLYAIGGITTGPVMEEYDPVLNSWSPKASLIIPRCRFSAITFNNKIYVFGGEVGSSLRINSVEEYDPITDTWTQKASMPYAVCLAGVAQVNGKIYVLCGASNSYFEDYVQEYDPITDTWSLKQNLGIEMGQLSASVIGKKIYLFGGANPVRKSTIEEYDPTTQTVSEIHRFPLDSARGALSTIFLNGKIYAIGGDKISDADKIFNFDRRDDIAYKDNYAFYSPAWCSDLVLDNLTWTPTTINSGNNVTFSAIVRNIGSQATPRGIVHKVHFYVDGIEVARSDNYTSYIDPGQSITVTANSGAWTAVGGTHRITAKIELVSSTQENDIYNNIFEKLMIVN